MILLLFGAPGSGKGTQSELLVSKNNFFQISTGDLLRNSIRNLTNLGKTAKTFMDQGLLVPDELVIGLVEEVLSKQLSCGVSSFIFDGFPRTLNQAKSLNDLLFKFNLKIDSVVFIDVDRLKLVERLTGRRVCGSCGSIFHKINSPSMLDDKCDKCGSALVIRSDDKEVIILSRFEAFEKVSDLLKNFYSGFGVITEVNGDQPVETVYTSIVSKVCIMKC